MKLQKLTLVLENCDVIEIDGKYIGGIIVDDIHTSIRRLASNSIDEINKCREFAVEIHRDANKERYQFDQTQIEDFKQMTFARIAGSADITHIELDFIDEDADGMELLKHYNYSVDWVGESDYVNEAQNSYISTLKHLYLVISGSKTFDDYYDVEQVNDERYMDFHMKMCGLGD